MLSLPHVDFLWMSEGLMTIKRQTKKTQPARLCGFLFMFLVVVVIYGIPIIATAHCRPLSKEWLIKKNKHMLLQEHATGWFSTSWCIDYIHPKQNQTASSPVCEKCSSADGSLGRLLWFSPTLHSFWNAIFECLSFTYSRDIQPNHDLAIFGLLCKDFWTAIQHAGCFATRNGGY